MGECAFGLSEVGHSDCTDATVRTASGEPVVMMGVCLINRCSGAVVHAHELESPRIKTKRT
jgi:hypothetical protein